jgi:hypothetical protein
MYSHFSRAPRFSNGKKVSSFWEHAKPEILMFVILHPPMQKIFQFGDAVQLARKAFLHLPASKGQPF